MLLKALEISAFIFFVFGFLTILFKMKKNDEVFEKIPKLSEIEAIFIASEHLEDKKTWIPKEIKYNEITKVWEIYLQKKENVNITKQIFVNSENKEVEII